MLDVCGQVPASENQLRQEIAGLAVIVHQGQTNPIQGASLDNHSLEGYVHISAVKGDYAARYLKKVSAQIPQIPVI